MKKPTAMLTPFDIASFSFKKGYSQALSWVKEIGELFDDPKSEEAVNFIIDQLSEGQEEVHAQFMEKLHLEPVVITAETDTPQ